MGNYYQSISVANGGIVARCVECKKLTFVRWVTCVTWLAGDPKNEDKNIYRMCDPCTDTEILRATDMGATFNDHRRPIGAES